MIIIMPLSNLFSSINYSESRLKTTHNNCQLKCFYNLNLYIIHLYLNLILFSSNMWEHISLGSFNFEEWSSKVQQVVKYIYLIISLGSTDKLDKLPIRNGRNDKRKETRKNKYKQTNKITNSNPLKKTFLNIPQLDHWKEIWDYRT